jgi:hypothetical protein
MNTNRRDDWLSALGHLGSASPDPARSEALLTSATRTIVRRRSEAEKRMALVAGCCRVAEPVAACALSAAFLAAVFGQAVFVIAQAHATFLWR